VEGQFRCRELFYRKDGGGDPVRDADGFHLLHQSSPEKKLVEGSEVGVRRIFVTRSKYHPIQKVYQIKLGEDPSSLAASSLGEAKKLMSRVKEF